MGRPSLAAFTVLTVMIIAGCSSNYTRHMNENYKDTKIEAKTFAILPVMDITYTPPSNCMGSESGTGSIYEKPWLEAVEKDLRNNFKDQKFRAYSVDELDELKIDAPALYSVASDEIMTMGVTKVESGPEGPPKLTYETARPGGKVGRFLRALHDSDKVDYVILLVEPKMTGETHTTYGGSGGAANFGAPGGGAGFGGGGGTTTTTYTSDVQFGVWSAETGELAYSSGAIRASSGFCIFVSPQQASINGTSIDIMTQLKALIALLLKEAPEGPVELGWSGPGSP